jgi:hypothetical protein
MEGQPSKRIYSAEETLLNFAIVFRGTLQDFEDVKKYILDHGALLTYQMKSTEKLWIMRGEAPK